MAIKHKPTGITHKKEGKKTGCGIKIYSKPTHWIDTHSKITCNKNGCKN